MTVRFGNYRTVFYVAVFLLSGTVLGLAGNFASLFLPKLHHDFTIFSLLVPSLTIFTFLLTLQWAQPRTEAIALFIMAALWLAMGAWSTDVIGYIQCDGLAGQRTATKHGDMDARQFCYEMKVIQAFSWMIFILFASAFAILVALVSQAQSFGRHEIWDEPIRELGWFGEYPGYYNTHAGQYAGGHMPYGYPMPMQVGNGQYMHQPGQSIVIQPGINGQPATVSTVPLGAA